MEEAEDTTGVVGHTQDSQVRLDRRRLPATSRTAV
jgi:hypothetical protein